MFYKSETCRRFHDEETGLYLQGNLSVLNDFLAEISKIGDCVRCLLDDVGAVADFAII